MLDTLSRYGKLSREEINDLWIKSAVSDGHPIPKRSFYAYRRAIEEIFNIDILCDPSGRYYIDRNGDPSQMKITNWLLESFSVNTAIKEAAIPSDKVALEEVPSAREFLPTVIHAIGDHLKVSFTYAGFSRTRPEAGIIFLPYFVKRYKQRWYMVGLKESDNTVRTYALDRVKELVTLTAHFEMPDITPSDFFENLIGITFSKADVRRVKIRTTPVQAKYFRALPFHHTQQEMVTDSYSIFTYKLKLNYELVHELLSYGDAIKVLEPRELVMMVTDQLTKTLSQYSPVDLM